MSARLLVATLTAALGAAALAVPSGAAVAQDVRQTYWVPKDRTFVMHGHGYGHGHGMSQYGAQGAATQGLTYRQIAQFYYPGTSWGQVSGTVRVLITGDTTRDVAVTAVPQLAVKDLGSGRSYVLPSISGVRQWRVNVDGQGRSVIGYLTGRWHRWHPGGRDALAGDGEFSAPTPLTLVTPSGQRSYRGVLRSATPRPGSTDRDTVNVLSVDDYIKGVIPREMPASWHPQAVRAQAVAARTYATWSRGQYPDRYYQICDTTSCQVYGGMSSEDARANRAVDDTRRQILTTGGKPAFTQFSSSSGGWTSAGSVPYLAAKADPYDGYRANPVHDWTVQLAASKVERAYPRLGSLRRIQVTRRDGNGEWGGRVWTLVLDGTKADVTVSGDTFRSVLGLRSTWFAFEPAPAP